MRIVRRISALALVVTLSSIGVLLPAHAAGEESPSLTLDGLPLSQLLNRTATGDSLLLSGLLRQSDGQISGVLVDADGQPLADRRVELSRPSSEGQGRLIATTDANGAFSYTGLGPGRYEVQFRVDDEVQARSGSVNLTMDAMQVSGLTVLVEPASGSGMSTGKWIAVGAGVGAAVFLMVAFVCGAGSDSGNCHAF